MGERYHGGDELRVECFRQLVSCWRGELTVGNAHIASFVFNDSLSLRSVTAQRVRRSCVAPTALTCDRSLFQLVPKITGYEVGGNIR